MSHLNYSDSGANGTMFKVASISPKFVSTRETLLVVGSEQGFSKCRGRATKFGGRRNFGKVKKITLPLIRLLLPFNKITFVCKNS